MSSRAACLLYAEDEPDDVFFMRTALRRVGLSPELRTVNDGDQVIAYLSGRPPFHSRDAHPAPMLVLLDLNLPVRSGFEVLSWIRNDAQYRDLPVVIFSSSGRPEDRARARELGATGYILKPSSGLEFTQAAAELHRWLGALK